MHMQSHAVNLMNGADRARAWKAPDNPGPSISTTPSLFPRHRELIWLAVWLAASAPRAGSAQSVTAPATSTAGWVVTGTGTGWTVGNNGVALNQFQVSAQGYTIRNPLAQQNIAETYSGLAVKDNPAGRSTSTGKNLRENNCSKLVAYLLGLIV